jgi:hypothetical protein
MLTVRRGRVSALKILLRDYLRGPVPSGNHIGMTSGTHSGVDDVHAPAIGNDLSRIHVRAVCASMMKIAVDASRGEVSYLMSTSHQFGFSGN